VVAIVGQGYVGLPLSIICSKHFENVIGIDSDFTKIEALRAALSYVEDVDSRDLSGALRSGFEPTNDFSRISNASIIVICVPTPLNEEGDPDLTSLNKACQEIAKHVAEGALIINQSTSYPSTVREMIAPLIIEKSGKTKLKFAVSPERVNPGNREWSYTNTPRIVGGLDKEALEKAVRFYRNFCMEVLSVSSLEVAEMSKLLENSYRLVNISLVNEFASLAREMEIDIFEVIEAAATKPYGFAKFSPSIGVGGHCIPVDPVYASNFGRRMGIELSVVEEATRVNFKVTRSLFETICKKFPDKGKKILVCGISYKPGVSDTRESASIKLLQLLRQQYVNVVWWDSLISNNLGELSHDLSSKVHLAIITQEIDDKSFSQISENAEQIIDCSGKFRNRPKVLSW